MIMGGRTFECTFPSGGQNRYHAAGAAGAQVRCPRARADEPRCAPTSSRGDSRAHDGATDGATDGVRSQVAALLPAALGVGEARALVL